MIDFWFTRNSKQINRKHRFFASIQEKNKEYSQ